MEMSLSGKRAIITAGGAGIGRATATAITACGGTVCICDIDGEALAETRAALPDVHTIVADVSNQNSVSDLFDEAIEWLGGLDILVNNAGIAGPRKRIEDIQSLEIEKTMAVNLYGHFFCASHAVPYLKRAGGGSIVNISSVAGRLGYAGRTVYSASKWAIIGLTKSLAIELGSSRIRVNALCPGAVDGQPLRRAIEARAQATGLDIAEVLDQYLRQASMRMLVSAEDVAHMVVYLCSTWGDRISGQAIGIDANTEFLFSEFRE